MTVRVKALLHTVATYSWDIHKDNAAASAKLEWNVLLVSEKIFLLSVETKVKDETENNCSPIS